MSQYGVAVYGIGWVAREHIRAWQANPETSVTALSSRNKESALCAKEELELNCVVEDDFEALLKRDDVHIIDLCTPNALHTPLGVAAAQAGKHLVVEKPVAMNIEELITLQRAVEQAGVAFQTGFVLRFNPYCRTVKDLVRQGAFGKVFYVETDYYHEIGPWWSGFRWGAHTKKGGPSASLVAGCHAVDLLSWYGGKVEEVFAYCTFGHRKEYEYPPTYSAAIRFASGAVGKTGNSFENECPYFINTVLHGSEGSVFNEKYFSRKVFSGQKGWQTFNTVMPESGDVAHHPFREMVDDMVEALNNGRPTLCNLEDSVETHQICMAIDLSMETGQPVKLPLK